MASGVIAGVAATNCDNIATLGSAIHRLDLNVERYSATSARPTSSARSPASGTWNTKPQLSLAASFAEATLRRSRPTDAEGVRHRNTCRSPLQHARRSRDIAHIERGRAYASRYACSSGPLAQECRVSGGTEFSADRSYVNASWKEQFDAGWHPSRGEAVDGSEAGNPPCQSESSS